MKKSFAFGRKPPGTKKFRDFNVPVRSKKHLNSMVASKPKLQQTLNAIFSKKGLAAAGVGTGAAVAGVLANDYIWDYIEANSGCFRKQADGTTCKVRELSCCQPDPLDNVSFCDPLPLLRNACNGFDEKAEKSCCRLCDCQETPCAEGETLLCQRPTVSDAIAHWGEKVGSVGSGLWSTLTGWFRWIPYLFYGAAVLLAFGVGHWILSRWMPRSGNQDARATH